MENTITFIKKNIKWIILLLCLIIFLKIAQDVFQNEIWKFDNEIYKFISLYISKPITVIFKIITNLSSAIFVLIISLLILLICKEKKYGIYSFVNLLLIVSINQILKHIVKRPRPTEFRIIDESRL